MPNPSACVPDWHWRKGGRSVNFEREFALTSLSFPPHPTNACKLYQKTLPTRSNFWEKMHLLMHESSLHTERACQKGFHCLRSIDTLRQIGLGVDGNLIPCKCVWFGGNIDENDVLVDKSRKWQLKLLSTNTCARNRLSYISEVFTWCYKWKLTN